MMYLKNLMIWNHLMDQWISVNDQLPPLFEYVLLYATHPDIDLEKRGPNIFVGMRGNYGDDTYDSAWGDGWIAYESEDIKFWMSLPNAPDNV